MSKANAGPIPNHEEDKVGETPPVISDIHPKTHCRTLESPLSTNHLYEPHISHQSPFSKEESPLAHIAKIHLQIKAFLNTRFLTSKPPLGTEEQIVFMFTKWNLGSHPILSQRKSLWRHSNLLAIPAGKRKRDKKYVSKLGNVLWWE